MSWFFFSWWKAVSHLVFLRRWVVLEVVHLSGARVHAPPQRALQRLRIVGERAHEDLVEAGGKNGDLHRRGKEEFWDIILLDL